MSWIQIHFRMPGHLAPRVIEALEALDAAAVTTQDAGSEPLFDRLDGKSALWNEVTVSGLFPDDTDPEQLAAQVNGTLEQPVPWDVEVLADQDWSTAWQDRFKPLRFGDNLWVCPSWCPPPDPEGVNIILDPGMAFGTGTHATTALCLEWLSQQILTDKTVVDYGCGSGILAIAALKLGARYAWGVDVDPRAVEVSVNNAERNGVVGRYRAGVPGSLPPDTTFDVVIANILADTLIRLAPEIAGRVAENGRLVLSGILAGQVDAVAAHYPEFSFEQRLQEDWAALIGSRIRGEADARS
jgi:ribosomal protein L11 methyltransferase